MIRVLAFIEALTVTGPAKNLFEFCRAAQGRVELVLATFRRGPAADPFLDAAAALGLRTEVIRERSRFEPEQIRQIRRLAGALSPDIVQTHNTKSHFLVRLSGVWRSRPWVAFHHGHTTTDLKQRLYNQLDRWSLRAPRVVVAVSESFKRDLVRAGVPASRIRVLHNSVDPCFRERVGAADREGTRARLGIAPEERVLLAVGRLSREKAIADLVAAAARIASACVLVVGDGPERAAIDRAAAARGVRLVMAGQAGDVAPYYAAADLLVLPSLSEGSPNALLEAMTAGVPAVATRVGGVPEIVSDGETALLVPAAQPDALAAAISRALCDAALAARLARNAQELARARYSPQARADALVELYTRI